MAQQTEPAPAHPGGGPWNPPPPRSHKRLYRRTDDKVIGGVASGLADYFDIDPVLARIGFVVLAIAGGAGVLAYLVMWWVVPPTHEVSNPGEDAIRRLKRAPSWVAIALLILGGVLLANSLGPHNPDIVWGLGLVAIGVLLFWHTSGRGRREAAPEVVAPAGPPVASTGDSAPAQTNEPHAGAYAAATTVPYAAATTVPFAPVAEPGTVAPPSTGGIPPQPSWSEWDRPRRYQPPPKPPKPPRERSGLGLATFGAALLAVGLAALLDNWGLFDVSLVQYLALGLTVLSIGLLVGAWVGRARWLILPAVLLVPFIMVASLVDVPFKGGWGDRTLAPRAIEGTSVTYRQIAGRMVIDLSRLQTDPGDGALHVTATEVAGSLEVIVPRDVPVHVDARTGAGAMNILGVYDDGLEVHRQAGQSPARAEIELDLAVSFGRIVVSRSQT